jgi:uncharacterized membrane protein YgaE (UPF0421/DUF939 family)
MNEGSQAARLRKLERDIRRRIDVRMALGRTLSSVPAALQIVVAATGAYAFAHFVLGHAVPLVAVTVTISALGFARDARPRRVLESVIGILVGIALAEVILLVIGQGVWQLALVLFTTLLVARLVSPSNAFAVAAGVQSMLVMLLPPPDGGVFIRSIDGLVGGALALLVTALIPRDPRRIALADTRKLHSILQESLDTVVNALVRADEPAASLALERLRRTQAVIDESNTSLETAIAVSSISPFLRRHLPGLRRQAALNTGLDLAARHLRLITRRIDFLVRDGVPRPELAALFEVVGDGLAALPERSPELVELAARLDPVVALPEADVTDSIMVHLMRPLVVDLLVASGMQLEEARALLPRV